MNMAITRQGGDISAAIATVRTFDRLFQLKPLELESLCLQPAICGLDTAKSAMPRSLIARLAQLSTNEADQRNGAKVQFWSKAQVQGKHLTR